jgi:hypothetical protein
MHGLRILLHHATNTARATRSSRPHRLGSIVTTVACCRTQGNRPHPQPWRSAAAGVPLTSTCILCSTIFASLALACRRRRGGVFRSAWPAWRLQHCAIIRARESAVNPETVRTLCLSPKTFGPLKPNSKWGQGCVIVGFGS